MYTGLTEHCASELLKKNGRNMLKEEEQKSLFSMFLSQIFNFTNLILAAAIVISAILQDYAEAVIIAIIVIANGIIGVVQEKKAQNALEALKKMSVLKANIIRDGIRKEISADELVVGDIVLIEAGQQVPADIKLLETHNLKIDEKALTGESVPVEKYSSFVPDTNTQIGDRLDMAYMTTIVTYGRAVGCVEKTGMNTEIGKIADMVGKEKEKPSPLQQAMTSLSKMLGILCVIICVIVCITGLLQGKPLLDMLMTSVSLAVAAIPEGIPTIVTIVMALGMLKMAKVNAIVKNLPAVETLGSVTYVCSDKTGTLTQNRMTVVKAFCNGQFTDLSNCTLRDKSRFLKGFVLCNDASISEDGKEIGDPTETALLSYALHNELDDIVFSKSNVEHIHPRMDELAFDSDRKLMTTLHKAERHKTISFTKGSTDAILERCTRIMDNGTIRNITEEDKQNINNAMTQMSDEALRVLSLAVRYDDQIPTEHDLIYIGMVGMIDPERKEVAESIRVFTDAGIKTLMITGDHKNTAFAIAQKLGIAKSIDECIMGYEIDSMSDDELVKRISNLSVFARVSPEHKSRIVKALQANGNIVSMTGDGTNDAPSLKAADVGVAMGITGTDVAKGAADIVLQDDSFTTIERAIREGRNIYENIKKSILFAISSNISEIITIFITILLGFVSPLSAVHLLWINLLTDSLPCFALGVDNNSSSDIMKKKPRKVGESIFANGGLFTVILYSCLIAFLTISGFLYPSLKYAFGTGTSLSLLPQVLNHPDILIKSQTYAFCILALAELTYAIGMRDTNTSIFKFKWLDNKLMLAAVGFGFIIQLAVTEIPILRTLFNVSPMSFIEWICIIGVACIPLVIHETIVLFKRKTI